MRERMTVDGEEVDKGCEHVIGLRNLLTLNRIAIWAENATSPRGWVNVRCEQCGVTFETVLREVKP